MWLNLNDLIKLSLLSWSVSGLNQNSPLLIDLLTKILSSPSAYFENANGSLLESFPILGVNLNNQGN